MENKSYNFLQGGGEMGELIRSTNWSETPLGPPETWPESLRLATRIILSTPFPMYIAWGNEYTQLYNDGYRPILGSTKHPRAMGISTRETFAEIWHIIGSMFDGVMQGKAVGFPNFMLPLERNGYVEECYFDFSYSPIYSAEGTVGGVLVTVIETTENLKNVAKLKQSESNFKKLIQQAPVAICSLAGRELIIESANGRMLSFWGKSDTIIHKPLAEALPELEGQPFLQILDEVFTSGEAFYADEAQVYLEHDGALKSDYFNFIYQPIKDDKELTLSIMVIAIDVTGLVTARLEKEQAEEKFRLLADNISQLAWMGDDTGGLFWYNKRWYDYTGTTFEEMQGWGWAKVQHPDHLERVKAKWGEHFPMGKEWEDVFPLRSSKGEYRWFLSRALPVKNAEGKTILWFGTNTDITEKLAFEQALADKNRELSFLADSIPSIVWTSKPDGELDYINQRWHELNPSKDKEPLGNTWLNNLHPDDVEHTREAWTNSINTGDPYEVEFRISDENENYRWYLVRALPMRDSEGRIVKWYGINTDIQEQKELQQRKEDFISIASHELKTPITALKASLQLLHRMKDNPTDKFPRLIEQSVRSMHKVSTLIEDLLNSNRMKAAELPLNKSTFIISELLNGSCNHISLSGKHDLIILGDKQLQVCADERTLDQVVVNLVNNAVKYAPGSRDIYLIIEHVGEMAKVSVKDSGPGIEPNKLPYLFDRYYQVSSAGYNSAGLGLGLYISAEIIKRHGGEMGVESELGRGSTFWFTLPLE